MTAQSIYHQLRNQLDQYSVGFPTTASGIELKILQRLFSEEEARIYLEMSMMLETPEQVAARTGRDQRDTAALLEQMAAKGLLFRKRGAQQTHYAAVAFVIGSYEFQLKTMDRELAEMMEAYLEEGLLDFTPGKNIIPLRTIPVQQSIQVTHPVAPYAQAREIIKTKQVIALSDCICRVQQQLLDKGCGKPRKCAFRSDRMPTIMSTTNWDATSPKTKPWRFWPNLKKPAWSTSPPTWSIPAACATAAAIAAVCCARWPNCPNRLKPCSTTIVPRWTAGCA